MKAILLSSHGGPDLLQYGEIAPPEPKAGEVLVKLHAAALNRLDIWVRQGWPGIKLEYPHIPGADGAGEIAALGPGVTRWRVGQRVVINPGIGCGRCQLCREGHDNLCREWRLLGEQVRGTYAEFVAVSERQLYPIPAAASYRTAAAAALVYVTAWHSLVTRGNVRSSESVLVVGASGGVNTASIQVAHLLGAMVYVVASSPEKAELAKKLGADHVIDRSKDENWPKAVYELTEKRGADVIVDNVGTTYPQSFRAAAKGGRILTVGNTGGPKIEIDNRFIFGKHLSLIGSTMGTPYDFAAVMELVFSGRLEVALDRHYPLADARAAQERLEKGEQMGKITLEIG